MSVNIKFPLKRSSKGAFATNDLTVDAIADNINLLIITNHGERPIHYDFGANLRPLIFEQVNENIKEQISDRILVAAAQWMPYVNITDIQVIIPSEDLSLHPNEVRIKIKFEVAREGFEGYLETSVRA